MTRRGFSGLLAAALGALGLGAWASAEPEPMIGQFMTLDEFDRWFCSYCGHEFDACRQRASSGIYPGKDVLGIKLESVEPRWLVFKAIMSESSNASASLHIRRSL